MKYYNVKFTFDIPIAVTDEDGEVDAYYAARDRFGEFSINEATIAIKEIDEKKYNSENNVINKLHKDE